MYTVGIDLCDDYLIAYAGNDGVFINVPTAVCREKHGDGWHIGEQAYRMALSGEGVITDKLLTLLRIDGTSTIMRKTYSAAELLSKLMEQVLSELSGGQDISLIDRIVIAIHKPELDLISKVISACITIGIDNEKITVISHEEAFIHYTLSSDKELYSNRVALFDLSGEDLSYYEFMVIRGISKNSVVAEANDEESVKLPAFSKMKKADLIDFAHDNGIELDPKLKNSEMVDIIKEKLD